MSRKLLSLFLTVCLTTAGCGGFFWVRPLDGTALLQEVSGNRSVILINLTYVLDWMPGKLYPNELFGTRGYDPRIEVINLTTSEAPKYIDRIFSTSPEDLNEGWMFFNLEPGNYFLKFYQESDNCSIEFGLSVPQGKHVIYVGAYQRAVGGNEVDKTRACKNKLYTFDRPWQQAQDIADKYFSSLGPLEISIAPEFFDNPMPLGIAYKEDSALNPIDWIGRGQERALSKFPLFFWVCQGSGTLLDIPIFGLCLGSGVIALGTVGIGSIAGKLEKSQWQACESKVTEAIKNIDVRSVLRDALHRSLAEQGFMPATDMAGQQNLLEQTANRGLKSLIELRFDNLHFQEIHNEFFLAAKVNAVLWDVINHKSLRAWSLSAEEAGWPDEKSHSLAALCQGDTDALIRNETSRLIEAYVRRIGRDINTASRGNVSK